MALGAHPRSVLGMVVRTGLALAGTGILIGLAGSFALTRYIRGSLFGIQLTDPFTFTVVAFLLLIVALAASWIPAKRAAAVDPMEALRYE